ncbi:RNA 2',3'-cyclic phosphodiesterase [Desulfogranum japonicum]|uniref:RNA 2',3'-cyclic phosphodiesterase n=1 Tax=Desulfogranum japonicum TaxID=231447 RepID=UPI00040C983F|nr:RNA 2',3'-cyclic phosphodiesterase [Desulfogranum japonicum]
MQKRLFVALDLPENIQERIRPLCCGLPNARWIPPEQLHLTLSFIGEVDGATFHDIREALHGISAPTLQLQLDGIGFFPPRGKPRVVWIGLARNQVLYDVQKKIHTRLLQLGLDMETRKYSPHITIARLNNTPAAKVGRYMEEYGLFCTQEFEVSQFVLYSSVLGRKGATHLVEQAYPLCR